MNLGAAEDETESESEIRVPGEVDWHMLDKSRFFFLGAALFSGVSAALYPAIVLKTRQQVAASRISCFRMSFSIMKYEGFRGFYRGFGTSLMGTIPARALYMGSLEVTKSSVGRATVGLGCSDTTATAVSNAVAGLSSAMAAQLVWTPIDVVSQRLMVQTSINRNKTEIPPNVNSCRYSNGLDAFRKIVCSDGVKGLYRGFGISILTYAPSNAVWWASYSISNKFIWSSLGKKDESDSKAVLAVQGLSASMASGVSAAITMPLDTIKTRLQVMDAEENGRMRPLTITQTMKNLIKEGGLSACYRGLGPRWASMSLSATTMITTYEFLKRLSTKTPENTAS